jgi:hypothetical protein
MKKIKPIKRTGLTLIELMVVSGLATVCMLAVGTVVVNNQKTWNITYSRAHESIMINSHLAKKAFEATIRKASCEKYLLDLPDSDGKSHWVEVYYFDSDASAATDRYAKLFVEGGTFYIEDGVISPRSSLSVTPICNNVTAFSFSGSGRCIRLEMTLSDNDTDVSFISSAIPQNQ